MGEAIIAGLHIKSDDEVLDIAAGTGEPGLTIAALAPDGQVTGTDLSENMLWQVTQFTYECTFTQ